MNKKKGLPGEGLVSEVRKLADLFQEWVDAGFPESPDSSEPDDWSEALEESVSHMEQWHNTTEACAALRILADRITRLEAKEVKGNVFKREYWCRQCGDHFFAREVHCTHCGSGNTSSHVGKGECQGVVWG